MKNKNAILKLIALVLSVMAILGCLCSCGGDKGVTSDPSSAPSEVEPSSDVSSEEVVSSTPDTTSSDAASQPEPVVSAPAESAPATSTPVASIPVTSTPQPDLGPTKAPEELIVGRWKGMDNFTPVLEQVAQVELDDVNCEMTVEFAADGTMTFIVDKTTFALTYYPVFEAYFEKVAEEWSKQTGYDAAEYGAHYTNANGISPSEYTTTIIEAVAKAVNMSARYKFENGKCFVGDSTGANWEENPVEFVNDNTMIDKTNNQTYTRVS